MNTQTTLLACLPYIVLSAGLLVVMLGVCIRRTHFVAWSLTMVTLLATLASHLPGYEALGGGTGVTMLFHVDGISYVFNVLFVLAAIFTAVIAYQYVDERFRFREEFYLLLLAATLGSLMLPSATHFVSLLLGLEIVSISLYAMVAYPEKVRGPLEAGLKYMILSGASTSAILFGMALIYAASGSMEFSQVSPVSGSAEGDIFYLIGHAFFWSGIAFKLSLVPFHIWTPDVYQGAPSIVTGFIATVSKGGVFVVVMRYVMESDVLSSEAITQAIFLIAAISMIVGNLLALQQKDLKRLLAYSSIAHMGYLVIALLLVATQPAIGFETAIVYLAGYFVMTLAAFGVITVISHRSDSEMASIDDINGLLWRRPIPAATLVVSALSLAGIPLTMGFIAKFYLFAAGIEGEMWTLVGLLVLGSAIGIFYYLRIIFAMTSKPEGQLDATQRESWTGIGAVAVLGVATLGLGIYPTPLVDLVQNLVRVSGF
ncbi:MAG: NADH-quinone oxidoreductase subunit N [Gammaproteobacteria bacterium]|nr:NADH-quinone oxidoreductase subunit N [Gammaproteobacteria bacterium]